MKRYDELTELQQIKGADACLGYILRDIIKEKVRFDDESNGDNLQAQIDTAIKKAEIMRTPWFAHEYIMASCGKLLRGMAECQAEDCLYSSPDEKIIEGIAE